MLVEAEGPNPANTPRGVAAIRPAVIPPFRKASAVGHRIKPANSDTSADLKVRSEPSLPRLFHGRLAHLTVPAGLGHRDRMLRLRRVDAHEDGAILRHGSSSLR